MRKSLLSVVILLALAVGFGCSKKDESSAPATSPEATESTMPATDDAAMPATDDSTMDSSTEAAPADAAAPADDMSK